MKYQPEQDTVQTTAEPGPSTVQMNSDPRPTDISVSDNDSGFVESSDTCAEPGMDQLLSLPYDVDFNANDSVNSFVVENKHPYGMQLVPDGTLKDRQTLMDVNVKDVTHNECKHTMTHMIDELDIPFSTEMSVEMESSKEKIIKHVDVDVNSTPDSQIYVSQDYRKNTFINDYGHFESFSLVRDLNNDAKYTVGADGLIFGGPYILASHLDRCTKTNWKKVQVWRAEDTWSYVGSGMSVPNGSNETEDVYELPMVENMLATDRKKGNLTVTLVNSCAKDNAVVWCNNA